MPNPIVIDISHHQPDPIDWAKVKAGGTIGVIHKATEGTSYVDDKLFARGKAAMDAGLLWATYHFMRESDMVGQMKHYLNTIKPVQGERVVLDHEHSGTSLAELVEAVEYLNAQRPDLQIAIYSGHLIKEQLGGDHNSVLAAKTSLWIAQYTSASAPSWPYATWPAWSLWQYTDRSKVDGIAGPVDGNEWNGSTENLIKWFGPVSETPPQPQPEPDEPTVDIVTTGKVRVTINGVEVVTP